MLIPPIAWHFWSESKRLNEVESLRRQLEETQRKLQEAEKRCPYPCDSCKEFESHL